MARTKKQKDVYYAITMCGSFFLESDLREFITEKIGEDAGEAELQELLSLFFDGINFNQYSAFMKNVIMIHTDNVLYESEEEEKGVYIGLPFFDVPDHFSVKRVCIDVRNLFINAGIIDDDMDSEFVKVFNKILILKDDELKDIKG